MEQTLSFKNRRPAKCIPSDGEFARLDQASARLEDAEPEKILRWSFDEFGTSLTLATGFGAEGVALIDMAATLDPGIDIFFIDTSFLFPETHELRRRLEDRYRLAIRSYETELTPELQALKFGPSLWATDPDLCCRLRKVEPLREALRNRRAWITAIRRGQTRERSAARTVEWDYHWQIVKINPLAHWTREQVWEYIRRHNVPYNPLHDRGYPSIGCTHCTVPVSSFDDERAGRWPGREKKECGMHWAPGVQLRSVTTPALSFPARVQTNQVRSGDENGRYERG